MLGGSGGRELIGGSIDRDVEASGGLRRARPLLGSSLCSSSMARRSDSAPVSGASASTQRRASMPARRPGGRRHRRRSSGVEAVPWRTGVAQSPQRRRRRPTRRRRVLERHACSRRLTLRLEHRERADGSVSCWAVRVVDMAGLERRCFHGRVTHPQTRAGADAAPTSLRSSPTATLRSDSSAPVLAEQHDDWG